MKKRFSIAVVLLALVLTPLFSTFQVCAQESQDGMLTEEQLDKLNRAYADYYIKDLDVDITVKEDNVFHIQETYVYDFVTAHHGPERSFSLNHVRQYADGSAFITADVKHLDVYSEDAPDDIADTESDETSMLVRIGDEDRMVQGEHTYVFTYDYKIYTKDPIEDADELYFNIVGTGYNCPIQHVTWKVHMPKEFDTSTVGYSVGSEGEAGYREEFLTTTVDDRVITGEYNNVLLSGEGITIRAELPEGYFIYKTHAILGYIMAAIAILLGILCMVPWHGLPKQPVEVVTFYPPNDMSPVAVETAYTGKTPKKITAMIPYLANKGYFDIEKKGKDITFIIKKDFADEEELDTAGVTFFEGIKGKKKSGDKRKLNDLKKKFYTSIESIKAYYAIEAENQFNKKTVKDSRVATVAAAFIGFMLMFPISTFIPNNPIRTDYVIGPIILTVLGFGLGLLANYGRIVKWIVRVIMGVVTVSDIIELGSYVSLSKNNPLFIEDVLNCSMVLGFLFEFLIILLSSLKKHRTDESVEILGQLIGFKNFIKTAELDRIKMLCEENPNYFYDILGYAYVFGLESKWISNFDALKDSIPEQTWYRDADMVGNMYMFNTFNTMMHSTTQTINTNAVTMTSSSGGYSNSGGGGFSGGGFSGGGSGGGGGGAW